MAQPRNEIERSCPLLSLMLHYGNFIQYDARHNCDHVGRIIISFQTTMGSIAAEHSEPSMKPGLNKNWTHAHRRFHNCHTNALRTPAIASARVHDRSAGAGNLVSDGRHRTLPNAQCSRGLNPPRRVLCGRRAVQSEFVAGNRRVYRTGIQRIRDLQKDGLGGRNHSSREQDHGNRGLPWSSYCRAGYKRTCS